MTLLIAWRTSPLPSRAVGANGGNTGERRRIRSRPRRSCSRTCGAGPAPRHLLDHDSFDSHFPSRSPSGRRYFALDEQALPLQGVGRRRSPSMQDNDPYEILGVAKTATSVEIRAAYLKGVRKHHPDKNPGDPTASWFFRQIQRAYEQLDKGTPPRAASASGPGPGPSAARGAGDGSYGPGSSRQSGAPPGSAGSSRSSHARRPASGAPRGSHSAPGAAGSRPRPAHTAASYGVVGRRRRSPVLAPRLALLGIVPVPAALTPRARLLARVLLLPAGGGRPAAGGHASREPSVEESLRRMGPPTGRRPAPALGRAAAPAARRRPLGGPVRLTVCLGLGSVMCAPVRPCRPRPPPARGLPFPVPARRLRLNRRLRRLLRRPAPATLRRRRLLLVPLLVPAPCRRRPAPAHSCPHLASLVVLLSWFLRFLLTPRVLLSLCTSAGASGRPSSWSTCRPAIRGSPFKPAWRVSSFSVSSSVRAAASPPSR